MKKIMKRLFTMTLLAMVSMGAWADVDVQIANDGKFDGGTIKYVGQTKPDEKGLVTVTITVTPDKGYTIKSTDITVVSTYAPGSSATRNDAPQIAANLTLLGKDPEDLGKERDYTFIVSSTFGAWVKEANFHSDENPSKGPVRSVQIHSLADITDPAGSYILASDFSTSGTPKVNGTGAEIGAEGNRFTGTIDGGLVPITGTWDKPLFNYAKDATFKNIIIESVGISNPDNSAAALVSNATGDTRIYNCGINGGSIGAKSDKMAGGFVGYLYGTSRVINCYSYATITSGKVVGGIVANNTVKSTAGSIQTMVMNCMFYGDITGGTTVSPIYGGEIIDNLNNGKDDGTSGLNNFNYYAYDKLKTMAITNKKYNCALAVEEKYLNRIEFYRLLLNSNKKLAAYYASTATTTVNPNDMAKWVLETADRTIQNPKPYPVLKAQGKHPSIINIDADHAEQLTLENGRPSKSDRNKGGKIGTLTVKINIGSGYPTGAGIKEGKSQITLNRTDKDEARFNFNYDKVQLPYYNDVGTKNYTENKVVTGWKITAIDAVTGDPYTSANYPTSGVRDYPDHNYADRKSSNKDLYSVSGRVFSQGAYFDVPYGVTSITIEPYWGNAAYVADEYLDVVCKMEQTTRTQSSKRNDYIAQQVIPLGKQYDSQTITIDGSEQTVYTSVAAALADSHLTDATVYDNAVVLIGNLHQIGVPSDGDKAFTMMSVDLDKDNEPDHSLFFCDNNRCLISPIRFDFLNIPGMAQAQKPSNTGVLLNAAIFRTKGWFEISNTALMYFSQFEYENLGKNTGDNPQDNSGRTADAPLILQGGFIDQFVSTQNTTVTGKVIYIHVGGNVLINSFGLGTHSDGGNSTPHVPVSVTGGDFKEFYLTGTYNQNATAKDDNAECYISGGRFGELAGAAQEQIGANKNAKGGNIHWQIYNADIKQFFGGGVNDAKPVKGNITTDIFNSHVDLFCGGPKFGNMAANKTVTTTAEGCTFGNYFGAGYGGNSFSRKKYFDNTTYSWSTLQGYYTADRGKYFNGTTTNSRDGGTGNNQYGQKGPGVATDFDYEFFVWTSGAAGVRYYVKFASFSLAQCNNVTSNLKKCTVSENFYGGGSLGKVTGTATSTLEDCEVTGNVFGAGYSATLPEIKVRSGGFTKAPNFNSSSGMFEPGTYSGTDDYTWKQVASFPNEGDAGFDGEQVITTQDISSTNLGSVGEAILTIKGNTTVGGSVYGGGEESAVDGDTEVSVNGGTIGVANAPEYGAIVGNVYGGGKGLANSVTAGLVKGDTNVTISGTPQIYHNIYGGGAYGSVGVFTYADDAYHTANPKVPVGMPYARTSGGTCTVNIEGGTIGVNGKENGMVFGSSRGDVSAPGADGVDPNDRMAWVYDTHVTIGGSGKDPQIKGSVYGSGENGHTFNDTEVIVHSGTIGITDTDTDGGPRYPYRGNVYGGGCGTDVYYTSDEAGTTPVAENYEGTKYTWYNLNAGIVLGNTTVNIDGGHVVHSVYGGGAMGSVGKYELVDEAYNTAHPDAILPIDKPHECTSGGRCTITISGGTIGNEGASMKTAGGPDDFGHVFGAGRGETRDTTVYKNLPLVGYVNKTIVTIGGSAFITGSVYGGAENSHVLGNTDVTIQENCQIGNGEGVNRLYTTDEWASASLKECAHWDYKDAYSPYDIYAGNQPSDALSGAANPATDGHTFYGNVFGGGSGYYPYEAGKWVRSAGLVEGNTTVKITGGHILSNVYGGNEHTDVYGKCTVTMSGGTVGVPMTYTDKRNHPVTGNLFGAGKGDKRVLFNTWTNVASTNVTVSGGTIYGSVFGGGEDGHVLGDATTTITQAEGKTTIIGTLGTTGYDGNVFGGGRGSYTALTAGVVCGNTEVNIEGGLMMGSVYGGGRLASVGTHLVPPSGSSDESHPYYGKLIPDGKRQIIGQEDVDASDITHGHTVIKITGGKIGYDKAGNLISSSFSTGDVFGACKGTTNGSFATQQSGYDPTTQAQAMLGVSKSSLVNLLGGIVGNSIYGGGELGNIGTAGSTETFFAKINLLGGQVKNVYGGGLGQKKVGETVPAAETLVMGDVKVSLNGLEKEDYDAVIHGSYVVELKLGTGENAPTDSYRTTGGCVVTGNIFGCNNLNGTPLGHAKVHVFKTVPQKAEPEETDYDVAAVYGGGNQADYKPTDTQQSTEVIIEGCDLSKIEYVYGGGNAAASPATSVLIMGSKHIKYIFGGGNGAGENNPGANVGYYTGGTETYTGLTKEHCKALVYLMAGNVDYIYGGSNSNGDIWGGSSVTNIDNTNGRGCCDQLIYKDIYGGGKDADMSGPANIIFTCTNSTSWGNDIYPGAENANIGGDVTITITSGKFKRVFGGNKYTGKIHGSITINIEENGKCGTPVIIGELYGGGNKAPYSVYGYDDNGNMLTSGTQKYANPQINVRAFTSIGNIYGGGLGSGAVMYGSPTVNINEVGFNKDAEGYQSNAYNGENVNVGQDEDAATVTLHPHTNGAMGVIDKIFGGGNAAKVEGNTTVNVGTTEYEYLLVTDELTVGTTDVSGYYTRSNTGTTVNPIFTYTKVADGTKAAAETNYYRQNAVKGADIRGNVYGGGNKAEVTGNTNVNIGQ